MPIAAEPTSLKGQFARAIQDFDAQVEINPRHAHAYNGRAQAYLIVGNPAQALPDAERALELHPNDPNFLRTRGSIFLALGRHEEALADLRQLRDKERAHPEPRD